MNNQDHLALIYNTPRIKKKVEKRFGYVIIYFVEYVVTG